MPEFYEPMPRIIIEYRLGPRASTVSTVIQQQPGIIVLTLFKHRKSFCLQDIEIIDISFTSDRTRWLIHKRSHSAVSHNSQSVKRSQTAIIYTILCQRLMQQISAVTIGQAILKYSEITGKWCWLGNENAGA